MFSLDVKTPAGALVWALGVIIAAILFRLGWELGGKFWMAF
jgi:hypothetical protein